MPRESALDRLRQACEASPDDAAVRAEFAEALHERLPNLVEKDREGYRRVLDELIALRLAHPGDGAVRGPLASSLFETHNAAFALWHDAETEEDMLGVLRALHRDHPEDAAVREQLARTLFNARNLWAGRGTLSRVREVLRELQDLERRHDDEPVRRRATNALFNTFNDALHSTGGEEEAAAWLDELRAGIERHPTDENTRWNLAMALYNLMNHEDDADVAGAVERSERSLAELRSLHDGAPDQGDVADQLSMGLLRHHVRCQEAGTPRDELLDELRALSAHHPRFVVHNSLARSLIAAHIAHRDSDARCSDSALAELRELAARVTLDWELQGTLEELGILAHPEE